MVSRVICEFWKCDEGAALVEAGLVIPIAALILAGGWEISRAIAFHHAIDKSVRNVARYMARLPNPTLATAQNLLNPIERCRVPPSTDCVRLLHPGTVMAVRLPADRLAAGYVRIEADVQYPLPLLSVLQANPTLTFTASHEEPTIPE